MNLDAIVNVMNSQVVHAENSVQAAMNLDTINNPTAMLQMQDAWRRYSLMVSYESTVMKTIKDMMTGILSRM